MKRIQGYLYFMDQFRKIDLTLGEVIDLFDRNPKEILNKVKSIIEELLECSIDDYSLGKIYYDPSKGEAVIEYFIRCKLGELSAKLIFSENPVEALKNFYDKEQKS